MRCWSIPSGRRVSSGPSGRVVASQLVERRDLDGHAGSFLGGHVGDRGGVHQRADLGDEWRTAGLATSSVRGRVSPSSAPAATRTPAAEDARVLRVVRWGRAGCGRVEAGTGLQPSEGTANHAWYRANRARCSAGVEVDVGKGVGVGAVLALRVLGEIVETWRAPPPV